MQADQAQEVGLDMGHTSASDTAPLQGPIPPDLLPVPVAFLNAVGTEPKEMWDNGRGDVKGKG